MTTLRIGGTPRAASPGPRVGPRPDPRVGLGPDTTLTGLTALAGLVTSVVGTLLVLVMPGHWPALAGALLIVSVPPGAAIMCWLDSGFGVVQAGLTLTLSLAITSLATASMIWVSAWHPRALFAIVLASSVSCIACLWQRGIPRISITARSDANRLWGGLAPLIIGLGAWAYGLSKIRVNSIGPYGLLADANIWFYLGIALVLGGGLAELMRSKPRAWLLSAYVFALVILIFAAVSLLYQAPEYGWVYKHVQVMLGFEKYGRITDTKNIYQEWPAFFTAGAAVCTIAGVGPLDFATWAPLAFELADALLVLGIFWMLGMNRRSAYFALFLYEGFIAWVGQDYLSPQAFAFMLWLGIANIMVRWLLIPGPDNRAGSRNVVTRLRHWLLARMPEPEPATRGERRIAFVLIAVIYSCIVAAHQLTPYMILLGVGTLFVLGVLWRGWLLLAMMAILAGGFLAPRYGFIVSTFGPLFGSSSAVSNASGVQTVVRQGPQVFTATFVHYLAAAMWLLAAAAVIRHIRRLGEVAVPALLAFSPFALIFIQNYGGEAIYRVYMFSAPWCALLIADALMELPATVWRRLIVTCACVAAVGAGMQGSYGVASVDAFSSQEISADLWLYTRAPQALIVMPDQNFPSVTAATSNTEAIPSDPQIGEDYLNEGNLTAVEEWMASFGQNTAYVVFSRSMQAYKNYYGVPVGYDELESDAAHAAGWQVVYRNADVTIYLVHMNEYGL